MVASMVHNIVRVFGLCIALLTSLGHGLRDRSRNTQGQPDVNTLGLESFPKDGIEGYSCSSLCQSLDSGSGYISGTSPACNASCSECSGTCKIVTLADGMDDYGKGCWTGNKVCCCDRAGPLPDYHPEQDRLTILNTNTYLLEVRVIGPVVKKPNLEERAAGYARWFNTLSEAEVPDVVVLTEILSWDAEDMIQSICSPLWWKNHYNGYAKFIPCSASSRFGFATQQVNARSTSDPLKGGGVVVLVKKGIMITAATDQVFSDSAGEEKFAYKGFWAVQMLKGTQKYWVFATHTQAYAGDENVAVRKAQFKQIRAYVDAHVEDGARIVFSGDFNTFTGPYVDGDGNTVTQAETPDLLSIMGAPGAPATDGTVMPLGFWLPLVKALPGFEGRPTTADCLGNHYINNLPDECRLGPQTWDWNLVPSSGDRLAAPTAKYQVVPMKDASCFGSDLVSGRSTDDLTDHLGVYSELCYAAGGCQSTPQLTGKRGSAGIVPAGPDCI